ncbi:hypothetical protein BLOT_008734 [Blomia tropicalis]|nr:hypothetical protein BLOT_008734 [Blomia tropicalis]
MKGNLVLACFIFLMVFNFILASKRKIRQANPVIKRTTKMDMDVKSTTVKSADNKEVSIILLVVLILYILTVAKNVRELEMLTTEKNKFNHAMIKSLDNETKIFFHKMAFCIGIITLAMGTGLAIALLYSHFTHAKKIPLNKEEININKTKLMNKTSEPNTTLQNNEVKLMV